MSDPEAQEERNKAQEARNVAQEGRDSHQRALLTLLTMVLIVMVVISVTGVFLKVSVDNGNEDRTADSIAAQRRSAENRYLQCFLARDDLLMVTKPERREPERVCAGFDTLEHAYATVGVTPPPNP